MQRLLKTLLAIVLISPMGASPARSEPARPLTIADAMARICRQDALPTASLERLVATYLGEYQNWRFHLREGKTIHNAVLDAAGRLSRSTRTDARSEREAEYWAGMPPAAQTIETFLNDAMIADARTQVEALGVPLTGAYVLRYAARRPNQSDRVALHTVEVIFELTKEERKGKRVVYRDGLFAELTDVKLLNIMIPAARPPEIAAPTIAIPTPRFPEAQYPVIKVPELSSTGVRFQEGDNLAIITLDGAILFDFDESDLRADAQGILQRLFELLTSRYSGAPVEVQGHTDSIGTAQYNQALSERRAESVMRWFVEQGLPQERLRAAGFGATVPVAPNLHPDGSDNREGRQKNRRVEVIVHKASV
ncbi:MAG: OmpA family protein [Gammaproteobacteria bacterium]